MPGLANGFAFVIDRRPKGHEDEYISGIDYTTYFSNRQIPIAAPGHRLYEHDLGHISSYQTMFANEMFADVVQKAAANALESKETIEQFTKAIDNLGDSMRNLENAQFYGTIDNPYTGPVLNANRQLFRLIKLSGTPLTEIADLQDQIAKQFMLPDYEARGERWRQANKGNLGANSIKYSSLTEPALDYQAFKFYEELPTNLDLKPKL